MKAKSIEMPTWLDATDNQDNASLQIGAQHFDLLVWMHVSAALAWFLAHACMRSLLGGSSGHGAIAAAKVRRSVFMLRV